LRSLRDNDYHVVHVVPAAPSADGAPLTPKPVNAAQLRLRSCRDM
jgi:hypothetical protein